MINAVVLKLGKDVAARTTCHRLRINQTTGKERSQYDSRDRRFQTRSSNKSAIRTVFVNALVQLHRACVIDWEGRGLQVSCKVVDSYDMGIYGSTPNFSIWQYGNAIDTSCSGIDTPQVHA